MNFQQKLDLIVTTNQSLVCVGLDQADYRSNVHIINQTHDLVCAYKLNSAFYEASGDRGVKQLQLTCDYLKKNHPEIPIILDAKRADIGSTNKAHIGYAFDYVGADAITLHPYLGREALEPFLNLKNKGLFRLFVAIIFIHLLVVGMWKQWYGGWAFGYRMASDVIPFMILLLIPYMNFENIKGVI